MNDLRRASSRSLAAFAAIFSVTLLALLAVGSVLPVLPRYVKGPLGAGDVAVGVVIGAFAFTALAGRPFAGHLADIRGRRPAVLLGSLLAALAGLLYFVPGGIPSLLAARLMLGAGEGMVFTAGAAWAVDLAPPGRRGRVLGLYGLSVWTGLSIGPAIGDLLLRAASYELVWAFAAAAPLAGAAIALRIPDVSRPGAAERGRGILARESLVPGAALALATVGFAAVASFLILHLEAREIGHGAAVFTVFAATVVATRLIAGDLPDRVGALRSALGAAAVEVCGLIVIAVAASLPVAIGGAIAMGAAFSLLYPSLSLFVVNRVPEARRGSALGTFTAFFDMGVGLGAPLTGAAVALGGYPAAFLTAAGFGCGTVLTVALLRRALSARARRLGAAVPGLAGSAPSRRS